MKNREMALALRTLRIANDFKPKEVALHMNVKSTYITDCERGDKCPRISTLDRYAEALGVCISDIISVRDYAREHTYCEVLRYSCDIINAKQI